LRPTRKYTADKAQNSNSNIPVSSAAHMNPSNKSQKPMFLFYLTPSNKENKKIDFSKVDQ